MDENKDGGRAFPQHVAIDPSSGDAHLSSTWQDGGGMSLRDWYAGHALQGILANPNRSNVADTFIVRDASKLADAMIAARQKES